MEQAYGTAQYRGSSGSPASTIGSFSNGLCRCPQEGDTALLALGGANVGVFRRLAAALTPNDEQSGNRQQPEVDDDGDQPYYQQASRHRTIRVGYKPQREGKA